MIQSVLMTSYKMEILEEFTNQATTFMCGGCGIALLAVFVTYLLLAL